MSSVTATTIQYTLDSRDTRDVFRANFLWIVSLTASIASAIQSQIAVIWIANPRRYEIQDSDLPDSWIVLGTPLLFFVIVVITFSGGLIAFTFATFHEVSIPRMAVTCTAVMLTTLTFSSRWWIIENIRDISAHIKGYGTSVKNVTDDVAGALARGPRCRRLRDPEAMSDADNRMQASPAWFPLYVDHSLRVASTSEKTRSERKGLPSDALAESVAAVKRVITPVEMEKALRGDPNLLGHFIAAGRRKDAIDYIVFSPNGFFLAFGSQTSSIHIWSIANETKGKDVTITDEHKIETTGSSGLSWCPDSTRSRLLSWFDTTLLLCDKVSRPSLSTFTPIIVSPTIVQSVIDPIE
jgi:hypothetical protein